MFRRRSNLIDAPSGSVHVRRRRHPSLHPRPGPAPQTAPARPRRVVSGRRRRAGVRRAADLPWRDGRPSLLPDRCRPRLPSKIRGAGRPTESRFRRVPGRPRRGEVHDRSWGDALRERGAGTWGPGAVWSDFEPPAGTEGEFRPR